MPDKPEDTAPQDPTAPNDAATTQPAEPQTDGDVQDEATRNTVTVEDAGTLKKKITVTVPRQTIDAKFDEMYGELVESAQVPGFRIGRAPRRLIEKRFGREVSGDVRNAIIGEALGDALEQSDLKTLGEPDIDLDAIELPDTGDMSFAFEVEVAPEFDLPELDGIPVTKQDVEITDERIDAFIENLLAGRARHEPTDEPAEEGDAVQAGVTIRGADIEPVEKHGLSLRVAPGQIEGLPIVDLAEKLAGNKAGDTVTLTLTAPQSHPNETWRGKELTLELSIGQVTRRILPDLDDEFAAGLGFDNVKELREYVAGRMQAQARSESQRALREQICQYLLDHTDFDLPEGVVARHTQRVLQRRYVDLLSQGVPREQIDERLAELHASASEQAQRDLKLRFILTEIADQQDVAVGDDEVNARIAQMAAAYNRRPERLRQELAQDGTLEEVHSTLREEKVLDNLLDRAKITESTGDEADEAAADEEAAENKKTSTRTSAKKASKKSSKKSAKKSAKKASKKADKKTAKTPAKKPAKKPKKKSDAEGKDA
ncbi:MAG: trigger factor [Phycisphaerae bacterium]|nr:trigger factor [Phycisphaerae bacterium]